MTESPNSVYLRPRYAQTWGTEFWALVGQDLVDGIKILDVGGGRMPTLEPARRPPGTWYAGLDVSRDELLAAPPGSYDEIFVVDAQDTLQSLRERFDLIISWQALEHVRDMRAVAQSFREYLRPAGAAVACLSGRNAVFAVGNRLLPQAAASHLVAWVMRRPRETVFPAHYDRCDANGLRAAFASFAEVDVVPLWRGATYLDRFPRLRRLYLAYEDWAVRGERDNLATHYVLAARKSR